VRIVKAVSLIYAPREDCGLDGKVAFKRNTKIIIVRTVGLENRKGSIERTECLEEAEELAKSNSPVKLRNGLQSTIDYFRILEGDLGSSFWQYQFVSGLSISVRFTFILHAIPELAQFKGYSSRIYELRNKLAHDDKFYLSKKELVELIERSKQLEEFVSKEVEPKMKEGKRSMFSSLDESFMTEYERMKGWAEEVRYLDDSVKFGEYDAFAPRVEFYDGCYENIAALTPGDLVTHMLDMRELTVELRHLYDEMSTEIDRMAAEAESPH
jgi:hypothetical protein